jgi:hypothetical protein
MTGRDSEIPRKRIAQKQRVDPPLRAPRRFEACQDRSPNSGPTIRSVQSRRDEDVVDATSPRQERHSTRDIHYVARLAGYADR